MKRKAVFFDIDGTLLDYKYGIRRSTKEAIKHLINKGHYAFICTGRSRILVSDEEILDLGFDGVIAGAGTYVEYQRQELYNNEIEYEIIKETIKILKEHQIAVIFEGKDRLYYDEEFAYDDRVMEIGTYLQSQLGDKLIPINKCMEEYAINKLSAAYESEKDYQEAKELLKNYYEYLEHENRIVEMIPKGNSKATGIKTICDHLSIKQEDTYAFGDSINDVEMLKYAAVGIAMGNGSKIAKETADFVTRDINEDGICYALTHFGLI